MWMSLVTLKSTSLVVCWNKSLTGVTSKKNCKRKIGTVRKDYSFKNCCLKGWKKKCGESWRKMWEQSVLMEEIPIH